MSAPKDEKKAALTAAAILAAAHGPEFNALELLFSGEEQLLWGDPLDRLQATLSPPHCRDMSATVH